MGCANLFVHRSVVLTFVLLAMLFNGGGLPAEALACSKDLDGDQEVGAGDLGALLGSWGPCDDCAACPADFGGDCMVDAADLAPLLANWGPCEAVGCDDPGACQLPDQQGHAGVVAATSDLNPQAGFRVADNFAVAQDGSIDALCWWGVYIDFVVDEDCSPGAGDAFTVTYYDDDAGGTLPGSVRAGPLPVTLSAAADDGNDISSTVGSLNEFRFEGDHPPVPVTAGECLWIEIANGTAGSCVWLWVTAPPGDGQGAQHAGPGDYQPGDETNFDLAWCVNTPVGDATACLPGTDCCFGHGTPGCSDPACEAAVCTADPFCCNSSWDDICALMAADLCTICQ